MNSKTVVLIPDGESTLTKHVVHCLSMDKSIEIHVLSKDPNSSIKHSRFVKSFAAYDPAVIGQVEPPKDRPVNSYMDEIIRFHYYDAAKADALIAVIAKHAREIHAEVIFPIDEHIVKLLASRKESLGCPLAPLPDLDTFLKAIDKWRLAESLKGSDVPHPSTVRYAKGFSSEVLKNVSFPVIIKPIDQGNAQGIFTFQTPDELLAFFGKQELEHDYIIQPFIEGYDIDCSCLCLNGTILAYTIQRGILSSKNRFAAAVGIEFLQNDQLLEVVGKLMKRLNWSGVAHIDLRYDKSTDQIKVIEINARYWGSLLGSLNAGINFPLLAIKTVKGESFAPPSFMHNRYFMGKSPLKKLWKDAFRTGSRRVRFRDTSFYYTLRDPKPAVYEFLNKLRH